MDKEPESLPRSEARLESSPGAAGVVLLTGATGFVGQRLMVALGASGVRVRALSRQGEARQASAREALAQKAGSPEAGAQPEIGGVEWVSGDVHDGAALDRALDGCVAAFYLVHAVGEGRHYVRDESAAADVFARAAAKAKLRRVVYLGGVAPQGEASRHLRSRLRVGERLREGPVPCLELRASMIVGHGSVSWTMVRDLAGRLPVMLLPRWLETRSQPIGVADVVRALVRGLTIPLEASTTWDLAGRDLLTGREILVATATLLGHKPVMLAVPFVTPRLSSYWIQLVTRVPGSLARELVEGLRSDLLPARSGFFEAFGLPAPASFVDVARVALAEESRAPKPADT